MIIYLFLLFFIIIYYLFLFYLIRFPVPFPPFPPFLPPPNLKRMKKIGATSSVFLHPRSSGDDEIGRLAISTTISLLTQSSKPKEPKPTIAS